MNIKKEKIIVICKFLPIPAYNGGAIRTLNWLKFLSKRYQLFIFGFQNPNFQDDSKKIEEMFTCKVYGFPVKFKIYERIKCFFSFLPASIKKYYSEDLFNMIDVVRKQENISKIFCSELCSSQYPIYRSLNFILDNHNIEYNLMKDILKISINPFKKLYLRCEWHFLRKFEIQAIKRSNKVLVTSLIDKNEALQYNKNVRVVNNASPELLKDYQKKDIFPSLVFTGNISRLPNRNGLSHFIKNILPKIRTKIPNIELYVIGSQIPDSIRKKDVEYIHFYENLSEEDKVKIIQKAWIGIVPLYAGSGTRIKITEYRSYKKPVVSTPKGAEGLIESIGTAIELNDNDFSERIIAICKNTVILEEMGEENFTKYKKEYTYDKVFTDSLYEDLYF